VSFQQVAASQPQPDWSSARPCLICGADVLFVPLAATGKRLVLDVKPSERVRVFQRYGVETVDYSGDTHTMAEPEMVAEVIDAYVAHTCPQAVSEP
jgi:hypothetical protein